MYIWTKYRVVLVVSPDIQPVSLHGLRICSLPCGRPAPGAHAFINASGPARLAGAVRQESYVHVRYLAEHSAAMLTWLQDEVLQAGYAP
jgi:hypothetical protein